MLRENVRIAFSGLLANKLRTLLSVLGILIGVMSVTLLLAVGAGASKFVSDQVGQLGTNTLYVYLKDETGTDATTAKIRKPALTRRDLAALRDSARTPSVLRVVPEQTSNVAVSAGRNSKPYNVTGTSDEWARVSNRGVTQGLMFTSADVRSRRRLVVIGRTIAKKLFPGVSPVGKSMRLGSANFYVSGVFERRGGGILGDQDSIIVVPETAMQDTMTGAFESYATFIIQMRPNATKTGPDDVTATIMREHGITDRANNDFELFNNAQLTKTSRSISLVLSAMLGFIAGISLLVGGIGVMNIMLVTVTERTREIGIRKALGAKRWHLLTQFLVESVVLTGAGGVIGATIGAALSQIKAGGFAPILQPWMLLLALGVSALIGITFGVYPANKAAKLRPIDALRFE